MGLELYWKKRDFRKTPEPRGRVSKADRHRFVVQEHHASMLHFDFRLEMGGVLKSWSVRKGVSLDPADKRLAVETEDHPVAYLKFQGHIPEGNYGAGEHMIWDEGTYELAEGTDPLEQFEKGRLDFELHGRKLRGAFHLVRMSGRENQWLLIKSNDEYAEAGYELPLLVETDRAAESWKKAKAAKKSKPAREVKRVKASRKDFREAVAAKTAFQQKELSGNLEVKIGSDVVTLTHLDKVYWPDEGYTKGDLIKYYYEVSEYILPYLKDRPLIMKRYPEGIRGLSFHQHDVNRAPEFVRTAEIDTEEGHAVDYIIGDNTATLLYMANLGAIERHPWHSRVRNLDHPDWVVFDLDPENVEFEEICAVAMTAKKILDGLGLESYAKTSGSRGIHVYVPCKPVHEYEEVARFAAHVAELITREHTDVATIERSLKKRKRSRIYVDHMQNARGKSVVAPYSVRPRAGATVSAPLEWSEVKRAKIRIQDFTIKNMVQRIEKKGELFQPVLKSKQMLKRAMRELDAIFKKPKAQSARV
ncbi:MAG: non-homologous end-joining DNA ligase [Pyrinomonadaceae bacterium]